MEKRAQSQGLRDGGQKIAPQSGQSNTPVGERVAQRKEAAVGCVGWREAEPELPGAPMGAELPGLPQQRAVDAHTRAHLCCTPVSASVQAHGALARPGTWATSRTPCSAPQPRGGKGLLRWDPSAPQEAARSGEGRSRGSPRCHLHLQRAIAALASLGRVSQGRCALAGGDACSWQEEAGTF